MAGKKAPNQKAVEGNAKKAAAADKKAADIAAQERAKEEKEWAKGANNRKAEREGDAVAKADEAARKKREKAELLAAEEAALGSGASKPKKVAPAKNKKNNDLALLENALVSAADKKVKAKKAEEKEKQHQIQNAAAAVVESAPLTESEKLLAATEEMLLGEGVGRQANKERMNAEETSGLDNALSSLGVSVPGEAKSAKALYNEFESKMLPIVKEENPGLRLSQYKEKVWQLWKKSPENPSNQVPKST